MATRRRRPAGRPADRAPGTVVDVNDVGVSGSSISVDALAEVLGDDELKMVVDRLRATAGGRLVEPGETVEVRRVPPAIVDSLFPICLVVAAGFDPVLQRDEKLPSVLWDTGTDRLLVHLAESSLVLGDGFADVHLIVQCDQTGHADVTVTLVTASMKRPAGFVVASEDRPRGPAIVVAVWGEALVALAWRALVELARRIAGAAGRDAFDRPYVASTVVATPDALLVTPMSPHRFVYLEDAPP